MSSQIFRDIMGSYRGFCISFGSMVFCKGHQRKGHTFFLLKAPFVDNFLTQCDNWCIGKVFAINISIQHLCVLLCSYLNRTSIIFYMFIFTGREHKLNVSNTHCCKFYWINKKRIYLFLSSFVGNEDGTIEYKKMCV